MGMMDMYLIEMPEMLSLEQIIHDILLERLPPWQLRIYVYYRALFDSSKIILVFGEGYEPTKYGDDWWIKQFCNSTGKLKWLELNQFIQDSQHQPKGEWLGQVSRIKFKGQDLSYVSRNSAIISLAGAYWCMASKNLITMGSGNNGLFCERLLHEPMLIYFQLGMKE